jgi:hypothetical protein
MNSATQKQIFELCFTRKSANEGAGLDLATVFEQNHSFIPFGEPTPGSQIPRARACGRRREAGQNPI